jgi:hypothetical protein
MPVMLMDSCQAGPPASRNGRIPGPRPLAAAMVVSEMNGPLSFPRRRKPRAAWLPAATITPADHFAAGPSKLRPGVLGSLVGNHLGMPRPGEHP